ncbi:acetolactate synthase, large subunit, biosynthetic type [Denitrovibrio acetiphilus DSM 12809]|uniref:Acetolactate synthase n=1 Tax=Denitrovibrio acetiphilus (strain DSM 12809 / NBRC 114555 / N2460) TaxID=522772 RepID=D4H3D0_DENA2|nr:biosynthetic-type acetolactate synthase large subunit [Denitrovibrio acetiphilus]ADD67214.1 acetolactate synthase, large subunit, biosynthetic type [Denitrovibrio acetiphilus DSM 12809]
MKMTGAEILVESLRKQGVDLIFGYPGGVLLGIYDTLFDSDIKHILPRHEQGGIHAADGYARATGKVGVCFGTSGPGATNLVTGICNAHMDSVPLVVFTGQVASNLIGGDAFQEADIIGITRPIVKHSYLINNPEEITTVIREAFYIAASGRPGPVVIDLPKDIMAQKAEFKWPSKIELPGYNPTVKGHLGQIKKMLRMLEGAKKPVIYMGGGVILSGASEEMTKLSELTGVPVISSFLGQGGIPGTHENYIGWLGMHGNYASNMAMAEPDFILAVGTRFSDRSTGRLDGFAPNAKVAHIDVDPSSISKNVRIDVPIVGDCKVVLNQALSEIDKYSWDKNLKARKDWMEKIKAWDKKQPFGYDRESTLIKPQYVVESIYKVTKGEAIICTEVGQNQMWAGQFYKYKNPRQFVSSGGLGTMGYGFPAAIGAKLGCPDKEVFDIAGDGSFMMNIQEICTAVQYNVAVKVAILNNKYLGMIRQWQNMFFNNRYSQCCLDCQPDFVKLAESFNAVGMRIDRKEDVEGAIRESLKIKDKPVIMDFTVDREENVFPMIPAGAAINEMLLK